MDNIESLPSDLNTQMLQFDDLFTDPVALTNKIYQLWWMYADFHLFITTPIFPIISPPKWIMPELLPDSDQFEFVYPIEDSGYKLSTSKAENMFSVGKSMCKLYYTIEKMIGIFVDRLESTDDGVHKDQEIQVAFAGHLLAQRKGFESVINLSYNVVVVNFNPDIWGKNYLRNVKRMSELGYGYPSSTPRKNFRELKGSKNAEKYNKK